jgi:hypothetical protein
MLYDKCASLLEHIERVVVFGSSPVLVHDVAKNERIIEEVVVSNTSSDVSGKRSFHGMLLFKRNVRKASYLSKKWKTRYFKIENQTLYCYHDEALTVMLRCISLLDSKLVVPKTHKYSFYFELHSTVSATYFQLRAANSADFSKWAEMLDL